MESAFTRDPKVIVNKGKRRSKNDVKDRNYRWGWGKKYLSYPALYTHIKQKHDGVDPPGTQTAMQKSSRGRGRPRKIYIAEDMQNARDRAEEAEQQK